MWRFFYASTKDASGKWLDWFDSNYWPPRPAEELLQRIDDCIQSDTPQPEPEYQEGVDY